MYFYYIYSSFLYLTPKSATSLPCQLGIPSPHFLNTAHIPMPILQCGLLSSGPACKEN